MGCAERSPADSRGFSPFFQNKEGQSCQASVRAICFKIQSCQTSVPVVPTASPVKHQRWLSSTPEHSRGCPRCLQAGAGHAAPPTGAGAPGAWGSPWPWPATDSDTNLTDVRCGRQWRESDLAGRTDWRGSVRRVREHLLQRDHLAVGLLTWDTQDKREAIKNISRDRSLPSQCTAGTAKVLAD